jgi:hypothetical protein
MEKLNLAKWSFQAASSFTFNCISQLRTTFIIFILTFLLLEFFLSFYTYFKYNSFLSASELYTKKFSTIYSEYADSGCRWGQSLGLHPYMSYYFSDGDCRNLRRNSRGFSAREFPLTKDSNYYSILMIGGSVAEHIASNDEFGSQSALEKALNAKWISPNRKPFRVINAALAGAHQPMNSIAALIYVDLADQVISVEGWNEGTQFKSTEFIETPALVWRQYAAAADNPITFKILNWLSDIIQYGHRSILKDSYTCYYFLELSNGFFYERFSRAMAKIDPYPRPATNWTETDRDELFLKSYASYIKKINAIVSSQGKNFTLFLQPNPHQYKLLSDEEKKLIGEDVSEKLSTVNSYLIKSLKNIHVESLLEVFKNNRESLYIDQIHTNFKGVDILANEISTRLAKKYRWRPQAK